MKKTLLLITKLLVVIFLLTLIVFASIKLYEYNKGKFDNRALAKDVVEVKETEEIPISVDFSALLAQNSDVTGWLYCEDTPINYAVVQADNNDYYLRRGIDGKYSYSGSLFADFRNSPDFSDKNTVIYGHNLKSSEMFGSLTNYKDQEYFDLHDKLLLITPSSTYTLLPIAGFEEKSTPEFYSELISFENPEDKINNFVSKSFFKSSYVFSEEDSFVTLSTCTDDYSATRFLLVCRISR